MRQPNWDKPRLQGPRDNDAAQLLQESFPPRGRGAEESVLGGRPPQTPSSVPVAAATERRGVLEIRARTELYFIVKRNMQNVVVEKY